MGWVVAVFAVVGALMLICTVYPVGAGCCMSTSNLCNKDLPQACRNLRDPKEENVLVSCQEGDDPVTIQQCLFACRTVKGRNGVCLSRSSAAQHDAAIKATTSASAAAQAGGELGEDATTQEFADKFHLSPSGVAILLKSNFVSVGDIKLLKGSLASAPLSAPLSAVDFGILRRFLNGDGPETVPAPTTEPPDNEETEASTKQMKTTASKTAANRRVITTTEAPAPSDDGDDADSAGSLPGLDTKSPAVQHAILDIINSYRRQAKAANMLKVSWDSVAAQSAQAAADRCQLKTTSITKELSSSCGQILAMGGGYTSWADVFARWNKQKENFEFGAANCNPTGREYRAYTQLVWAHSYQIGCAMSPCADSGGPLFICLFCPRGNKNGNCQPYLKGSSANGGVCGKCGGSNSALCSDGLCTNPCPFENSYRECDTIVNCSDQDDPNLEQCEATCKCRKSGLIYWIN
ncbi:putative Cysteine-rich venom protein DIS3 [Hypsibius exemplaris]|uniref:Cysteine-rich venom protein DIS3 n=1 Tax=Hypsibius exemplaris TaxID=2072580 RepID=A0A1W0WNK8_HYPEX|nr:putative Cysteine-rich venom protein DIS3 [Hypsibius exemplaris]